MDQRETPVFERGQVWYLDVSGGISDGLNSGRPVVIVSGPVDCERADAVMVVPLSKSKRQTMINLPVSINGRTGSFAICNNINQILKSRLRDYQGVLSDDEMKSIDDAMLVSLGLKDKVSKDDPVDEVDVIVERDMYKRLYERALEKLVEVAYARETREVREVRPAREPREVREPQKRREVKVIADAVEPEPSQEPEQESGKVNLNTCTVQDLMAIGIERSRAYIITGYRKKNGNYSDVLDLLKVKRLTPRFVERFESKLEV